MRWRDQVPIHPAADLFPLMSEAELRDMAEDIGKRGLHEPVALWVKDGETVLLDGRNRLDAMELAGAPFVATEHRLIDDPNLDPYAYVMSANIHRRHLTPEQRRVLIGKLLKAQPEKSDR